MRFEDLFSRCEAQDLQVLLGTQCTRLLALLDPNMSSPGFLRTLLLGSSPPASLLQEPSSRRLLFDRLRPNEAAALANLLDIPPGADVYASLAATNIATASPKERMLFDFFELPSPVQPSPEDPAPASTAPAYPLFDYQRVAARDVLRKISQQPHRVLLHMPTGSGKTRTAMHVISQHLRSKEPTLVVWLAFSEELCDQAAEEFHKAWTSIGDREMPILRFWGDHDADLLAPTDGMVICGLQKLLRFADRHYPDIGSLGTRTSLVVFDEAHQSVAPQYRRIVDALTVHHSSTALLGLSATPGRTWNDIDADEVLARHFHRQKVALHISGYPSPVNYLVDQGYLARAKFDRLFYSGGPSLSPTDLQRIRTALDIPQDILERLAEDEQRNLAIIARCEQLQEIHQRMILFAASVFHAHLIANVLRARGLTASAITTRTPSEQRKNLINAFKSPEGPPRILCNFGVLTTGFDAPQTSCVVIARPTSSLVLYSQMVGRAIRGPLAGGNENATIVTVIDQALPGFRSVAEAFANWEDIWTCP